MCVTTTTSCEDLWPQLDDLIIKLGDMYYSLAPEAYTYPIIATDVNLCGISVAKSFDANMRLGITFLRDFNVVFDHTNS